jgi:cell division protein FtsL
MLAHKLEYYQYPEYEEKVQIKKKAEPTVHRSSALNKQMYLILTMVLLFSSLFILQGYAKITSVRLDITKLEKEKTELFKIRQELESNLEGLKNTAVIAEQAKNYLGMIYPDEGQIAYVAVNDTTYVDTNVFSFADKVRNVLSIFSSLF